MEDEILRLLPIRKGHFRLESGHHGELWLDLELLCLDPQPIRRFAAEIAVRVAQHNVEIVCGPLVEGAFIALLAAWELGLPFCYAERIDTYGNQDEPLAAGKHEEAGQRADALYPVKYRIPGPLRPKVRGKRTAIVNDVINAGSAVRGTISDLEACGAQPVVIATLVVLGSWAPEYSKARGLALETIATLPNEIWAPADCPLCRNSVPLVSAASAGSYE